MDSVKGSVTLENNFFAEVSAKMPALETFKLFYSKE